MTSQAEENPSKLKDELEALKEKNALLEEQLSMQKKSWLYSHHLSLSICAGTLYGLVVASVIYLTAYFLYLQRFYIDFLVPIFLFVFYAFPLIAVMLFVPLVRAPRFAFNSLRMYLFSFWFFESLILYTDPLCFFIFTSSSSDRFNQIFSIVALQALFVAFLVIIVPQLANYWGYSLVLNGSAMSFEVDADSDTISGQLSKLEEDFNLVFEKSNSEGNRFLFTKLYEKKKSVLQIFLRQKENKTEVALVMHSIKNDIPMKTDYEELERVGKSLMKWLETIGKMTVHEANNEGLIAEVAQDSKKIFYRHPIKLPSKTMVGHFLKGHWKDIALVITVITAMLSWIFPLR